MTNYLQIVQDQLLCDWLKEDPVTQIWEWQIYILKVIAIISIIK